MVPIGPSPVINRKCKYCPDVCLPQKDVCEKHKNIKTFKPKQKRKPGQRRKRKRPVHPLYKTRAWLTFREGELAKNPLCFAHLQRGVAIAAVTLDHIIPLWYDPHQPLESERVQSLCISCHSKKTLAETFRKIAIDYKHEKIIHLK